MCLILSYLILFYLILFLSYLFYLIPKVSKHHPKPGRDPGTGRQVQRKDANSGGHSGALYVARNPVNENATSKRKCHVQSFINENVLSPENIVFEKVSF